MKIRLSSDQVVFLQLYRKSMKEREKIKAEIRKMLEAGVKRTSSSPVSVIPKKDGSKRMCVDYRRLNAITKVEDWPFPVISDILDRLSGIGANLSQVGDEGQEYACGYESRLLKGGGGAEVHYGISEKNALVWYSVLRHFVSIYMVDPTTC
jgi:hypothetical protein